MRTQMELKVKTGAYGVSIHDKHTLKKVCEMYGERQTTNADFIVKAVNAHDDLLAACLSAATLIEALQPESKVARECRAAIAKARGE